MNATTPYHERELLARLAVGEEVALTQIYQHHWEPLFVSAFNVLKDRAACEDILQEIFLQLWMKRETLTITSSLGAYLHTATKYQVFKYIRRANQREHLFEKLDQRIAEPSADKALQLKELNNQIHVIVESMPEQCRIIYKLSREEHLSHREIAERLNISPKTVENQLTIALRKLRLSLGDAALVLAVTGGMECLV